MYSITDYNGPDFERGDHIVLLTGIFEGETGTVAGYDRTTGMYLVTPDNEQYKSHQFAVLPSMIEPTDLDEDEDEDDYEEIKHPETPEIGMTSEQLAAYVEDFIDACTSRVTGVGDEQYSEGGTQKFESMGLDDLLTWAREEVQDLAVYAAMLDIRFARVQKALRDHL